MGNYGLRISTKGNNADTQSDKRTVYTSEFSTLKIFEKGTVDLLTDAGGNCTKKIVHGLGYAPIFYVFRQDAASFSLLDGTSYPNAFVPCPGNFTNWVQYHDTTDVYTDATNLTITIAGANNTHYYFTYYIFIDQGQHTLAGGNQPEEDYGLRVSSEGLDALEANEYQLNLSTGYNMLRYYPQLTSDFKPLTLPAIRGDFFDQTPQEGTYVDFFHQFGFPPFFLAYAYIDGYIYQIPDTYFNIGGNDDGYYELSAWSDRTKVRVTFWRKANWIRPDFSQSGAVTWDDASIEVRVFFFDENLSLPI